MQRPLLALGACLGAVAIGAACPVPHHSQPATAMALPGGAVAVQPSAPQRVAASGKAPARSPQRTVAPAHLPRRDDIEDLLSCRAEAWNIRSIKTLGACLAPDSQALSDDSGALREAARRQITYSGVGFHIESVHSVVLDHGVPTARVNIGQNQYGVRDEGQTRRIPATQQRIRLTVVGRPGSWRISSWNVG